MDSFKVYLPSNACPEFFPNNTSTDYYTRFDKPINLHGQWEVGMESITYSSHINDEKEKALMHFFVKSKEVKTVNSLFPYEFITTPQTQWKGFKGIMPNVFETNSTKIDSILDTLNAMNRQMLMPQKLAVHGRIFQFTFDEDKHVVYTCQSQGFTLQLTNRLSQLLGFGYQTVMSEATITAVEKPLTYEMLLTEGDYFMRYMHTAVQEFKGRIYIKKMEENVTEMSEESFLMLWKQNVTPHLKVTADFKSGKLVLTNNSANVGITFSKDFGDTFFMKDAFFGSGTRWSTFKSSMKSNHDSKTWYIDIFTTKLGLTHENKYQHLSTSLYPWRCKTKRKVLYLLNSQAQSLLKDALKEAYDAKKHNFQFSLELNETCKLELGPWVAWCYFSKNLSYLLGFPDHIISGRYSFGVREVDSLANHSRQLHVLSNVIKPTAYGNHQREILSEFLHKQQTLPMIEKRFNPIRYHPVARNNIDMIHVQVTDDDYKPISIRNAATIVTLYFRQVKEN